jgi:large subunit ribosomal protein L9
MKVILTEDVSGVGEIGETIKVRPGFARNYLIPRGLAVETESKNAGQLKHKMMQIEARKKRLKGEAQAVAERIRELTARFVLKVNSSGRVFGSISAKDIADNLKEAGFDCDRRRVLLTENLKKIGTHFVKVKLHQEVDVQLKVVIEGAEASAEDEQNAIQAAKKQLEEAAHE